MSYAIGTKLSYNGGSESAVLFAENKVMVTRADGQVMRQVLTLDDWLAFAGDQDIVADTSGVAKLAEQTEKALNTAAATYPNRPFGTMLRASSSTLHNGAPAKKQTAVVTTNYGILLVKKKDNDVVTYPKTQFESEAHWRASLPDDMTVTVTEPQSVVQKRQLQNPITSDMSDAQVLFVLKKTYKVKTTCYEYCSDNQLLANEREHLELVKLNKYQIAHISYYEDAVKRLEDKCASQTAEQNDSKPMKGRYHGKDAFYLIVGDEIHGVTTFENEQGKFIADLKTEQKYKCFEDIPGCLNAAGKPKLTVFYKNEYINLADKF